MKNDTLNYTNHINSIGENLKSNGKKGKKFKFNQAQRTILEKYGAWILGLFLSFVPLCAIPFVRYFNGEIIFINIFCEMFNSVEIIFIGISLAIAAINDFLNQKGQDDKKGWIGVNIAIIAFGAVIYGAAMVAEHFGTNFQDNLVNRFNLIYLVIVFLFCSSKYVKEFLEEVK